MAIEIKKYAVAKCDRCTNTAQFDDVQTATETPRNGWGRVSAWTYDGALFHADLLCPTCITALRAWRRRPTP